MIPRRETYRDEFGREFDVHEPRKIDYGYDNQKGAWRLADERWPLNSDDRELDFFGEHYATAPEARAALEAYNAGRE